MEFFSRFFGAFFTATPTPPTVMENVSSAETSLTETSTDSTGPQSEASSYPEKHELLRQRHKSSPGKIGEAILPRARNLLRPNDNRLPDGANRPTLDETPHNKGDHYIPKGLTTDSYTLRYNIPKFLNDLRCHTRSQKAIRGYFTTYKQILYPLIREDEYLSLYPNARRVLQRYYNVLKEEYFILLTQMRGLKRELAELHEEFASLCEEKEFSVPVEKVLARGYELEYLFKRTVENKFSEIDREADYLRTQLHCCKLLLEAFWGQNFHRRKPPLLNKDTWAEEAWNQWLLDIEEEEEDYEHRNSWWKYNWIDDLDALSPDERGLLQPRGKGWWRSDPDKDIDEERLSEVSGCVEDNAPRRPKYRSWGERRHRSLVEKHRHMLRTAGKPLILKFNNAYENRYEIIRLRRENPDSGIEDKNNLKKLIQEADKVVFNGSPTEPILNQMSFTTIDDPKDMRYRRYGIAGSPSDADRSENTRRANFRYEQNKPKKPVDRITHNYQQTKQSLQGFQRIHILAVTNNWRFNLNKSNHEVLPKPIFGPGGRLYDMALPPADGIGGERESWNFVWELTAARAANKEGNTPCTITEESEE
ncbi:hypothetical protein BDD12DRAFT_847887 [Trichophaea hybrida]|nr:hypothetical protein BDD12DRAFT_847887 [Trichophaea hybrida]